MEQELHLQPLPTSLSQGQGRWALGVPGVAGHRRPTEEQSLRLCQVTGGDGRTQSLQQSQQASGEADGSHPGGGEPQQKEPGECSELPNPRPPPSRLVRTKEAQTGRKSLEPAANPSLKDPG